MKRFKIALFAIIAPVLIGTSTSSPVKADDDYPSRPTRIIVGFAPGGVADLMARYVAKTFTDTWNQSFIVENRPGASGNIGAQFVSQSQPDGYTLLMTSVGHSINASLFPSLPFDPAASFTAISPVAVAPNSINVAASSPYKTLEDVLIFAKSHPGAMTYASPGIGTLTHIGIEQFAESAGVKFLHVPFNGTGPAINALLASDVQLLSTAYGSAAPFVSSGKMRMLAIATAKPSPLAPGIPTFADAGHIPGYEAIGWVGLLGPANLPKAVVEKLNTQIRMLQDSKEFIDWLATQGAQTYPLSPAEFSSVVKSDMQKWGKVVREAGIKGE